MTKEQRSERKSVWEENEFFLEGHHEYLTIISFYIVNKRAEFKKKEGLPSFLLVELPLKVGKKLAITAAWEIEQGLKSDVENALKRTPLEKKIIERPPGPNPCNFSDWRMRHAELRLHGELPNCLL